MGPRLGYGNARLGAATAETARLAAIRNRHRPGSDSAVQLPTVHVPRCCHRRDLDQEPQGKRRVLPDPDCVWFNRRYLHLWSAWRGHEYLCTEIGQRLFSTEGTARGQRGCGIRQLLQGNFPGGHEIRTPLNGTPGLTELLVNSKMSADQHDQLQTVYSSGKILLMTLNDALDFSKMEANQFELSSREFSANDLIDQVLRLYSQNASAKTIVLSGVGIRELHHFLLGDPNRLQQILTNLVSNAVKFTDRGTVELHTELLRETNHDVRLRFVVEDSGIGMSDEEVARLFQPFSQADESNSRNHSGNGRSASLSHSNSCCPRAGRHSRVAASPINKQKWRSLDFIIRILTPHVQVFPKSPSGWEIHTPPEWTGSGAKPPWPCTSIHRRIRSMPAPMGTTSARIAPRPC
ncbi:MAG: hypothetical protein GY747_07760 [Planctomycetes bacterium]|nr:hypothetical protein [Planctomycetota bacterium]MCP4772101.1 hypothetical protein [Planctomycetota bacterium]